MGDVMPNELSDLDLEVSEQDVLFGAYLDDELSADERAAFDARLREDPEFATAWEEFSNFMGAMHSLPFEFAPDDFVGSVKTQIRVRSRDRFFAEDTARMQFEVVAVVMVLVMTVTYLFMGVPADAGLHDVNVPDHAPSLLE